MATLLQRLPWLMFGLYAGVVADRKNRRAIVITTGLVRQNRASPRGRFTQLEHASPRRR